MASPAHKIAGTNWLFVRIDTDSGVSGWGEGSLQYKDAALEAEILDFGRFLEGKDPLASVNVDERLSQGRGAWRSGIPRPSE